MSEFDGFPPPEGRSAGGEKPDLRRLPPLTVLSFPGGAPPSLSEGPGKTLASASSRTVWQKYGGLFLLAALGFVVTLSWFGWFAWQAWGMRDVWVAVYRLNDVAEPLDQRLAAASYLARHPLVEDPQLWDLALRKDLPVPARYQLAEAVGSELVRADPQGMAKAVAFSPQWPVWLRIQGARMLALAVTEGITVPMAPLHELADNAEHPLIALWATYALAVGPPGGSGGGGQSETQQTRMEQARLALQTRAQRPDPTANVAQRLREVLDLAPDQRREALRAINRAQRPMVPELGWE